MFPESRDGARDSRPSLRFNTLYTLMLVLFWKKQSITKKDKICFVLFFILEYFCMFAVPTVAWKGQTESGTIQEGRIICGLF